MSGAPNTPERPGENHQASTWSTAGIPPITTDKEETGPNDCARCLQNRPYITYILGVLSEISQTTFAYNPVSCLLYRCRLNNDDNATKYKSCAELEEFYGYEDSNTKRTFPWEPSAPHIISTHNHHMLDIGKEKPTQTRIYIKWQTEYIIIDKIYRRALKFNPNDHEEFKRNLASALHETQAGHANINKIKDLYVLDDTIVIK